MAFQVRDQGLLVNGFTGLNRALERIGGGRSNFGIEYELQKRLRTIGETVAKAAPQFVTHKYGRAGTPALEDSVRVSVTTRSASVYSTAPHGGVQNVGGGPHAGWSARGPHVRKDKASGWMNRAVASEREFVRTETEGLIEWVLREFEVDRASVI